ncbi:hypothetical protein A2872_04375 [Candidatus Gottesmanbacteria bacterium RIFCSPHIGHO2_01_FULL_42_12]|uniref:Lipoprotein YerB n=1 Tax=Candidatus Gottesmanbacteria bacterium RIFCSPHIGHO2_01_FULL_42_12 TaxID=1798377 RepID=A0A1F5Z1W4_9BACT|nr:MAG: hypothetical protein A2872_04375 [Candidatus Gottesmanbacteria bacterium RIFCSPHIGHO2_01_FULL_42_12]
MSKKLALISGGLALYLLTAGGSFAFFSRSQGEASNFKSPRSEDTNQTTGFKRDPSLPRNEACPINGAYYTKPEREMWEKRRPLGVMIENSKVARPQSGLSFADVIYEAIAEGGIPRFLAVYYCQSPEYVGPVRSARTYFLDWISEYGNSPLYAHVGGANTPGPANALGQIDSYGWKLYNDLDNFSLGLPAYILDTDRLGPDTAIEHSKYGIPARLWESAAKRGLTNVEIDDRTSKELAWDSTFTLWKFKDDVALADRPQSFIADFSLSGVQTSYTGDYTIRWQYDKDSNSYLRENGGKAFTDMNNNQQVLAKNVILQFMTMSIANDGYNEEGHGTHTLYGTKGQGKAKILMDGKVTEATWTKKTRLDRTKFFDITGKEIALNRGLTWIEILPIGQAVTVQ